MDPKNLAGSLKAAILIQALGKNASEILLNGLNESERETIEGHLSKMGIISEDLVEKVAEEFTSKIRTRPKELGKPAETTSYPGSTNLKILQSMEPDNLIEIIKDEHPQTIALIIVHLKTEVASEILAKLPDEIKCDVAVRIAGLDKVMAGMVDELDKVFGNILKGKDASITHKTGGVGRLAEIINQIDATSAQIIMDGIEEKDVDLAEEIKQRMFVFDDLPLVDNKGLQKVLRKIESKDLATALKASSDDVKEKIFTNMSQRAGEMLREEIEEIGSVRMSDVETSQQMITKIIQDMESKGELVISGRRGEELIS